jgi:hypothetical protein
MSEIDLLVMALKAQGLYVVRKLPKSEQIRFSAEMDSIILTVEPSIDFNHAERAVAAKALTIKDKNILIRFFHNPVPTQRLAHAISQDIFDSFRQRFIDGGSKLYIGLLEEKFKLCNSK